MPYSNKFSITEKMLRDFAAQHLSSRDIASALGCSQCTVRHWLGVYGLKTNPEKSTNPEKRCRCGKCGETDRERFYGKRRNLCGRCHNTYTISKGRDIRERARALLGGRCSFCGFDTYQVALDIHHLDPSQKDARFAQLSSWSWKRVERELQGCVLLCKNCHVAVHAGLITLEQ